MTDIDTPEPDQGSEPETAPSASGTTSVDARKSDESYIYYYRFRFREVGQEFSGQSNIADLGTREVVMVQTDHGPEPAIIVARAPSAEEPSLGRKASFLIMRRASQEETERYALLPGQEAEGFRICNEKVHQLHLPMQLVRVERFFSGSKIIFYFTAESRVDFRELVKSLVQEFRTRVEMRQIGVRHETQMTGGIGPCGRELCCCSFLNKFESVSIKMAKTQDLPLNPSKISGLCNRLLCCLTYEYEAYREMKRGMPKVGRWITYKGTAYRVIRQMPLQESIQAVSKDGEEIVLTEEQWNEIESGPKGPPKQQPKKK